MRVKAAPKLFGKPMQELVPGRLYHAQWGVLTAELTVGTDRSRGWFTVETAPLDAVEAATPRGVTSQLERMLRKLNEATSLAMAPASPERKGRRK